MTNTKKNIQCDYEDENKNQCMVDKLRKQLGSAVKALEVSYAKHTGINNIRGSVLPSKQEVIRIIENFFCLIYPGFFSAEQIDESNLSFHTGSYMDDLYQSLSRQIFRSIQHTCSLKKSNCSHCRRQAAENAIAFIKTFPNLREMLELDVQAAYDGDPAAKSLHEIIFSYPGVFAITVYRASHELYKLGVPLIPRIMTEHAHNLTGIDIHPGATIGKSFFIDHGTGVVIGETCRIGNNVKMYHGVTLGARSFPKDEMGQLIRETKRHPTIEDNVTIYPGATILGGETVIGKGAVIGGNVWIRKKVTPGTMVVLAHQELNQMEMACEEKTKACKKPPAGKKKSK